MGLSKIMLGAVAALAVAVIVIIAAAVLLGGNEPNSDGIVEDDDSIDTTPQVPNGTMTGTSNGSTERFELHSGVAVFHLTHDGAGDFSMTLYSDDLTYVNPLVNENGSYIGTRLVGVNATDFVAAKPGQYYFQVEGEGAWTILVEQSNASTAARLPQTLSGSGDSVPAPFQLTSGTAVFTMSHAADGNFSAILWTADGAYGDLLVNEAKGTQSEKEVTIGTDLFQVPAGVCWLDISTDGLWTVSIAGREG
jgi:hypothetical protein